MPEVARERQRGRLLLELSRRVTGTLDLQGVLDTAFAAMRTLIAFQGGAIQLVDGDFLVPVATDPPLAAEHRMVRVPVGQGVSGSIAATGEPVYIPDITVDERVFPAGRAWATSSGVRSYFGVPLISGGAAVGVFQIDSPEVDAFAEADREVVLAFAPSIAAAVQNAQLYEREQQAVIDLREAQRMQRDFLAVVSHELRTPLTAIRGFTETLRARAGELSPDDVVLMGERISRSSRRLERLIVDLLDISQLERTRLAVNLKPADLEPVVRSAVDEFPDWEHAVKVVVADGSLPPALADERRVRQVLEHLLDNARKFSPPGTEIEVRLEEAVDPAGAADGAGRPVIALSVADQGPGIPAAAQSRVFERFFQVESSSTRPVGGLGVGLYLVKRLCDLMGATVEVVSREGAGARFVVRIPVADEAGESG